MKYRFPWGRVGLLVWLACAWILSTGVVRATIDPAVQTALGRPTHATTSPLDESDYLIVRPQYALAYSRYDGITRWVAWHLTADDIGSSGRTDAYAPDTSLPAGWYQVPGNPGWSTYGYDRGHMCPSGDRTRSVADNEKVFLMTNLIPQASDNNQGPWEKLETYCRDLAKLGNELYIVAGGRGYAKRLNDGKVTVPASTWKVIVVLAKGDNDIARMDATTRVIAVDMPNVAGIRADDWRKYRVSVDSLEASTGLEFLSNVPVFLQNTLEARVDAG